jgi:hypothetical protein
VLIVAPSFRSDIVLLVMNDGGPRQAAAEQGGRWVPNLIAGRGPVETK